RQTRDHSAAHWVAGICEHDWQGGGRSLERPHDRAARGEDHVRRSRDQIRRILTNALIVHRTPVAIDPHGAAQFPTEFLKRLRECAYDDQRFRPRSLWQATKHKHDACPVGSALANAPEVFSVEPDDFPAAKHMCESSVDREAKCPISSRQHYCKGLERKIVRKQRKIPQTFSLR